MATARLNSRFLLIASFIIIIFSSISLAAQNPAGTWKFDEGSGNQAFDSSGHGHTALLSSGVRWVNASSWAISADVSRKGYVTIPAIDLRGTNAVTVAFWAKRSYATSGGGALFEAGKNYQQSQTSFALLPDDEACHGIQAFLRGNEGTTANCYTQPTSDVWHHLAVVYDKSQTGGNAIAFYVDGVLQSPNWNLSAATNTNNFGQDPISLFSQSGSSQFSSGMVRDFQVYGGALSEEQVQQLYNDTMLSPSSPINYVQGNYSAPQTPQGSVAVRYTSAQSAGDLNVVVVGWNDSSATVTAVTDSKGNLYTRAVGPTVQSGKGTQSIYYAKNIAAAGAGTNTVTVTFSRNAKYPDIRIVEYSGADTNNPVDVTAAAMGSGNSSSSGSVTTTNANDLIFGADLVQTLTGAAGSGFTRRMLTTPDGDIVEDKAVSTAGSYAATATVMPSGAWIMQMVAFRATGAPALTSIAVTPTNPSIAVGGHQQFTATGTYSDGSHQDLTSSATWTSSNPSIATINSTGYATGVAAGSTTIKAAVGSINGSTTLTVTNAANFAISASPSALTIAQGNQGASTITTSISGGFNSSISLSASGVPTGAAIGFSPQTIPAPGSGSSVMTITVGASTAIGTYPITVTGNGGGMQHATTVTLTVTAPANFTISASPSSLSVPKGNRGTSTITTAISNGFNSSISLSTSGLPTGTTASFSPNPIPAPGSGNSTLTLTVGSNTAAGTYPITVTGNGGGVQQSVVVSLTVTTASTISYVQGNYATPQSPQSTVNVTYNNAQVAGDLNVIVVGWNDSNATVNSVQDSKGNVYTRAVGPTIVSGAISQSIYYAKNIVAAAAGSNTVTVTFSTGAYSADIRILEYSGADPNNPVDVTAAGSGNSSSSSSGSATTTNPTDLILGANIVLTLTSGPGGGFSSRMITSPDGDIAEDQMVSSAGSYSASAPLTASGAWIMQMVAFRTPGAPVLTSIAVTPTNPSIAVGGHQQFTATGTYSDGSHQDLTSSATWTSSNQSVATISSTGYATGVSAGSATIKAAMGSINGTTTLTVTGGGTFTISANPSSLSIAPGNQGASTITTSVSGGFNSSISLSASGVPSGTTVTFSPTTIPAPGSGTSTMTISVGAGTTAGTYPITVTGNGGGTQQSTTFTLTVTGAPTFSISASPSSLTVMQGHQGTSTMTTVVSGGFNNSISLSASGMPTGVTVTFNPSTIPAPGSGTSVMTVTVQSSARVGNYSFTVTGNGGGIQRTATINLTITAEITLSWTGSQSPGIAGYNVYRSMTTGGPYTKVNSGLVSNTNYNDTGVQDGNTYYYVTTAVDNQGMESTYSNEASALVP